MLTMRLVCDSAAASPLQEGKIKPWPVRGEIKPYVGNTKYVLNDEGLIFKHLETWEVRHCSMTIHRFGARDVATVP